MVGEDISAWLGAAAASDAPNARVALTEETICVTTSMQVTAAATIPLEASALLK
jgi:hypothetical protein